MTIKLKLLIEYDGTHYSGWQKQPLKRTIQEEMEKAFLKITGFELPVIASGRTDTGVHANGQVAHITLPNGNKAIIPTKLYYSLNAVLPSDIVIRDLSIVDPEFHARFSAKGKTYLYYLTKRKKISPFELPYRYSMPFPLDLKKIRHAASFFTGEHDFLAFSNTGRTYKTTIRTIRELNISENGDDIIIKISGNGFLYKMVRNIVGTLINVGQEKIPAESIITILESKNRTPAVETAPAKGLFLYKVFY